MYDVFGNLFPPSGQNTCLEIYNAVKYKYSVWLQTVINNMCAKISLQEINNARPPDYLNTQRTREGFLRKNIVAVSFFQNFAIHPYS